MPEATCQNCKFFNTTNNTCHRFPPSTTGAEQIEGNESWPLVKLSDWCGEFKQ